MCMATEGSDGGWGLVFGVQENRGNRGNLEIECEKMFPCTPRKKKDLWVFLVVLWV